MSRIGRQPIDIVDGVTVTYENNLVTVTGKLGTLTQCIDRNIKVNIEGNVINVTCANSLPENKAKHGLYRQLIANMVKGVSTGFEKTLIINGVGYKTTQNGEKITLNIGFSHPVVLIPDAGITLKAKSNSELIVSGISKEKVGQYAAKVRDLRPVEPYHAYGIRYSDEVVVRKQGKTSGKK